MTTILGIIMKNCQHMGDQYNVGSPETGNLVQNNTGPNIAVENYPLNGEDSVISGINGIETVPSSAVGIPNLEVIEPFEEGDDESVDGSVYGTPKLPFPGISTLYSVCFSPEEYALKNKLNQVSMDGCNGKKKAVTYSMESSPGICENPLIGSIKDSNKTEKLDWNDLERHDWANLKKLKPMGKPTDSLFALYSADLVGDRCENKNGWINLIVDSNKFQKFQKWELTELELRDRTAIDKLDSFKLNTSQYDADLKRIKEITGKDFNVGEYLDHNGTATSNKDANVSDMPSHYMSMVGRVWGHGIQLYTQINEIKEDKKKAWIGSLSNGGIKEFWYAMSEYFKVGNNHERYVFLLVDSDPGSSAYKNGESMNVTFEKLPFLMKALETALKAYGPLHSQTAVVAIPREYFSDSV
jgi:hypothetical protein